LILSEQLTQISLGDACLRLAVTNWPLPVPGNFPILPDPCLMSVVLNNEA
jgi:hypothetical protein